MTPKKQTSTHKPSSHERVTIVMVPYEQYSTFPTAVDTLYENTHHPFSLIVVEGNAPDSVRSALEKRKKHHKDVKIIYTNHLPLAGEARNLALPHIKTNWVFFMDNDVRVTPRWLSGLIHTAKETKAEIVCPAILNTQNPIYTLHSADMLQESSDINIHGFLITKNALNLIGEFDENTSSFTLGLDLSLKARAKNIEIRHDAKTCLKRNFVFSGKPQDMKLFHRQWDPEYHKKSLVSLKQRWDIQLDERKYLDWLQNKGRDLKQSAESYSVKGMKEHLQSRVNFARIKFRRLLHTFISL